jgi:hypothetical protein
MTTLAERIAGQIAAGDYDSTTLPDGPLDHRRAIVYQLAEDVMVTFVLIGDDDDNPVDAYVDCGNYADGSRTTAALSHEAFAPLWAELQGAFDYVEVPTRAARTCVNGHPLGEDGTCDAWCDERVTR